MTNTSETKNKLHTKDIVYIGIFAALITICSWISIPTVVPFTLQTFGIFLAAGVLGGKRGTLSVAVFILLGAIGLPVFSGFEGGFGTILGTKGGYIIGFLLAVMVVWFFEKMFGRKTWILAVSMVVGLLVCYFVGTIWFMEVYAKANGAVSLMTVLGWCVFPFVIPDLAKIALALLLSKRLYRFVQ